MSIQSNVSEAMGVNVKPSNGKLTLAALAVSMQAMQQSSDAKFAAIMQHLAGGNAAPLADSPPPAPPTQEEMLAAWYAANNPNAKYAGIAAPPAPVVRQTPPPHVPHIRQTSWEGRRGKQQSANVLDLGYVGGSPFLFGAGKARLILENLQLVRQLVAIDDALKAK